MAFRIELHKTEFHMINRRRRWAQNMPLKLVLGEGTWESVGKVRIVHTVKQLDTINE